MVRWAVSLLGLVVAFGADVVRRIVLAWIVLAPRPSNDRPWVDDQARVPTAELDGDVVTLHNVRSNTYRTTDDFDVRWYDKTVRLSELDSLWFAVEPFSEGSPVAHTFLSFGFADADYVAISVEIRREQGEKFSAVTGMLRQFELMYVIGDESDLVKLRTNFREDPVFLYRMRARPDDIRTLFVDMLEAANALAERPAFYNSVTRNCTTTIVDHINAIVPGTIPWTYQVLLPGYSDALAYDLGLVDTDLPFAEARWHFRINNEALDFADDPDFSRKIRKRL